MNQVFAHPPAQDAGRVPCPDCGNSIVSRSCKHGVNVGRPLFMAIDPGDLHQGVALFHRYKKGWRCSVAFETRAWDLMHLISIMGAVDGLDVVVYERFVLEPKRAPMLTGTDLETSQVIGAIKYQAGLHGIPIVGQTNKIKVPTKSILRARGIKSRAKKLGVGGHAADAELHGYHYLLRTLEETVWGANE